MHFISTHDSCDFQASKTTNEEEKKNQNSYLQTTQWTIWRIVKSLSLSHWQALLLLLQDPHSRPALPPHLGSHSTTASCQAPTLVKATPRSSTCTQKKTTKLINSVPLILPPNLPFDSPATSICKQGGGCVHAGGRADVAQTQSRSLCRASVP